MIDEVKDPSSRLARWNLSLQEYDFEIIHKPGKARGNTDSFSRIPVTFTQIYSRQSIKETQSVIILVTEPVI